MRRLLRLLHDERGAELLEAALTLPPVMLVTLAIINFGMVVYAGQMAQAAARHGARMGSVAQRNAAGIAAAEAGSFANGAFGLGNPQVSILAPGGVVGLDLAIMETGWFEQDLDGNLILPLDHFLRQREISFEKTIARLERMKPRQAVLTHIEEVNARSYDDYKALEREGLAFAYDGMEIEL
ncbi:MAG TPA: hypothetical protein EYP49_09235 [Anaerolineae bacterium]|nr:hypothetical protein [Anaerolineae bacterium]